MTPTLILMAKAPRAGRVKTRLAADTGTVAAVWWYRHQLTRALRQLDDRRWRLVLAVSPDITRPAVWPRRVARAGQGQGDLGQRMRRLLTWAPPGPVLVVGADIPGLARDHIARAFSVLGRHDAVFGPATDGGFWGVGLRRTRAVPPRLFEGVRWSGPHALSDSVVTCGTMSVGYADWLSDIDTAADLAAFRLKARQGQGRQAADSAAR